MIYFLIPMIVLITILITFVLKKFDSIEKKICINTVIINSFIILFFVLVNYVHATMLLLLNILINIIFMLLLLNSKIVINRKKAIVILSIYFLCMLFIPVYKFEDHKHIFVNETKEYVSNNSNTGTINDILEQGEDFLKLGNEKIEHYINYYNCYGIKIITLNSTVE